MTTANRTTTKMKAEFAVERPDAVQMTLHLTMPLSEWKDLRRQLDPLWPSSRLRETITEMVIMAEHHFYPLPKARPPIADLPPKEGETPVFTDVPF